MSNLEFEVEYKVMYSHMNNDGEYSRPVGICPITGTEATSG